MSSTTVFSKKKGGGVNTARLRNVNQPRHLHRLEYLQIDPSWKNQWAERHHHRPGSHENTSKSSYSCLDFCLTERVRPPRRDIRGVGGNVPYVDVDQTKHDQSMLIVFPPSDHILGRLI